MKVVFLGSPPFGTPVLEALLASSRRPVLVVTPPDRPSGRGRQLAPNPVASAARAAGVDVHQPTSARDTDLVERLRALSADVFVVASWGELLPEDFLALPRDVCLNVHPSLLPRHRGATPVQATILAGDVETGVAIQRMVLALDAGDLLHVERTHVDPAETAGELTGRLALLGGEATLRALDLVAAGEAVYTPQDAAAATHCKRMTKDDGEIDWTRPADVVARHVRAMNPWPGARTTLDDGRALALWSAGAVLGEGAPGTVLRADGELVVACGLGALALGRIQAAGKRALDAGEFLRGTPVAPGSQLGGAK